MAEETFLSRASRRPFVAMNTGRNKHEKVVDRRLMLSGARHFWCIGHRASEKQTQGERRRKRDFIHLIVQNVTVVVLLFDDGPRMNGHGEKRSCTDPPTLGSALAEPSSPPRANSGTKNFHMSRSFSGHTVAAILMAMMTFWHGRTANRKTTTFEKRQRMTKRPTRRRPRRR
jgi:hypothetical protein